MNSSINYSREADVIFNSAFLNVQQLLSDDRCYGAGLEFFVYLDFVVCPIVFDVFY